MHFVSRKISASANSRKRALLASTRSRGSRVGPSAVCSDRRSPARQRHVIRIATFASPHAGPDAGFCSGAKSSTQVRRPLDCATLRRNRRVPSRGQSRVQACAKPVLKLWNESGTNRARIADSHPVGLCSRPYLVAPRTGTPKSGKAARAYRRGRHWRRLIAGVAPEMIREPQGSPRMTAPRVRSLPVQATSSGHCFGSLLRVTASSRRPCPVAAWKRTASPA